MKKLIISIVILLILLPTIVLADNKGSFECLAKNIYFEARGEGMAGKIAVGLVTLNRVQSKRFPNSICEVVWQRKQFSWTHDGLSDVPTNFSAWSDARHAAEIVVMIYEVKDAKHYHNLTVFPPWANIDEYLGYIENHIFYK